MLKKVAIVLVLLVVVLVAVVATRPSESHIERSATIDASPAVVFSIVEDMRRFGEWSPWAELDPNMKTTFSGPERGEGAVYAWEGNDQVGAGRMTITELKAPEKVVLKLEFLKPWEATNVVTYTVVPAGDGSKVTWAMDGTNNFAMKAMTLFMDMDAMVGKDFEKGLAKLDTIAEAEAKKRAEEAAAAAEAEAAAEAAPEAEGDTGEP